MGRGRPLRLLAGALVGALVGALLATGTARADDALPGWLDRTAGHIIEQGQASGMAIVLLEGGQPVMSRGYGFADAAGTVPVDPATTPFSIGSITKSFTATALVRAQAAGTIASLDDPADRYLKRLKLGTASQRGPTVGELLSHRGGRDESIYKLATLAPVALPLPPAEITRRVPPAVRPPGEMAVYSNAGFGLLGIVLEDAGAGLYGDIIRRDVFAPLGMDRSFVRYDPAAPIAEPAMLGGGQREAVPQNWAYHPFILPSAGIVSTADDMARFAAAHLSADRGTDNVLLSAADARRMHGNYFRNAPGVSAMGLAFMVQDWNGVRVAENAGSGPGFQALLILLPDRDIALVALIMGGSTEAGRSLNMFDLRHDFLTQALGPFRPATRSPSGRPLSLYAGLYRAERRPHTSVETLLNPGAEIRVEAAGDNLIINGVTGFREVDDGIFWREGPKPFVPSPGDADLYAFKRGPDGAIAYVTPHLSVDIFRPVAVSRGTWAILALVGIAMTASGLALLIPAYGSSLGTDARAGLAGLALSSLCLPLIAWQGFFTNPNLMMQWATGDVTPFAVLAATANVTLLLTLAALLLLVRRLAGTGRVVWPALVHALLAVAGGAMLSASLAAHNLIGWNIPW
ncbi:serine hydrolase [Niveispirillum sp.]|uniref:serine hydrolase domain-containing protein n=1 Tax=Niveispirillum sp. TaxID=1917217 RepID=UPI001B3EDDB5|nr:serine hydrolase domain-containing protein [Niveispirillum sp.]MBP7337165.1 beta-lactamase family protein [Niveispirillum sp.]